MDSEHVGAVAAVAILLEMVGAAAGEANQPSHHVDDPPVVVCGRRKDRHPWRLREELLTGGVGRAGEQNQRLDFGMAARELDGVVDAATAACRANPRSIDARLRDQEVERGVDVARPVLLRDALPLGLWQIGERCAAALTIAAIVERDGVQALLRQLLAERRPCLPLAVAHVQQDDAGSRPGRREVGGLQPCAVRGLEVDLALFRMDAERPRAGDNRCRNPPSNLHRTSLPAGILCGLAPGTMRRGRHASARDERASARCG